MPPLAACKIFDLPESFAVDFFIQFRDWPVYDGFRWYEAEGVRLLAEANDAGGGFHGHVWQAGGLTQLRDVCFLV